MSNINSCSYLRVSGTAAGTTVILDHPGNLERIIFPANKTGTLSFYDIAVAGGSAATNFITAIANTTGTIPANMECGFGLKEASSQ